MSSYRQIYMRKSSLNDLPELSAKIGTLPSGISLHTHRTGEESVWEELIERCFGSRGNFEKSVSSCERYDPTHVFYLTRDGIDVAVSAAVQMPDFPNDGWLHYVGVDPPARGLGLAAHVVLATLYSFYAQGYSSVVLSTDDFRIPAIKTYLKLGFEPIIFDESHAERWHKVMAQIQK